MSAEAAVARVVAELQKIYGAWTRETTIQQMRDDWDAAFAIRACDWPVERLTIGRMDAEWIAAPGADPAHVVLYLHGGGFRIGSVRSHRDLIQRLSQASRARVLAIEYRLSPEHTFPAPVEDALAAYRWLLTAGHAPARIAISGDSAGGGLALACMLAARDAALPTPCAAYLMSPWTDMTASGASYETRADRDPMHQRAMMSGMARGYLGKSGDLRHPLASPLFANLVGLPPLLIQCGGREVILDDSIALAQRARESGVEAELEVYEDMIHVFQSYAELPDTARALGRAGAFLARRLTA
ncbi:MAG: alpha/beta hydrolase [Rhodoblastus sp.]|nr:alpha/beta hydrolase [Rhodoblastus sp.]